MLAASLTVILLPADEESVAEENRAMYTMPDTDAESLLSGEFSSGFENYVGDNLGYRSQLKWASSWLEGRKGITTKLGKIVSTNKDIGTGTTQKSSLLVVDGIVMEMFYKDREKEEIYINMLNYYAQNLNSNINLYSMLVPTQLEFQAPIYSNIQDSQADTINYIYNNVDSHVRPVNAYDELAAHSDEYLYYRTDHHWTTLGAYYGYRAFLDTVKNTIKQKKEFNGEEFTEEDAEEFRPVDIDAFEKNEIEGFLGYLYKQSQTPEIAENPDTIEWYDVNVDGNIEVENKYINEAGKTIDYNAVLYAKDKANYGFFFDGDQPLTILTNENKPDGRTLIIIKESYSNCFAPWIINNYHKVIMVDPRNYTGKFVDLVDKYEPDDVLVLNYIFTTIFDDYSNKVIELYK